MASYPNYDSPAEIQSQVGDDEESDEDSEAENEDTVSALQTQFATQAPMQVTPKKSKRSTGNEGSRGKDTKVDHPIQSVTKDKEYLLQILPDGVVLGHNPQPPRVENSSSPPEMTQMQIVAPSSHIPARAAHENDPYEGNQGIDIDATDAKSDRPLDTTPEQMPNVIVELLRGWRQECRDGRYIPRCLQKIPKDQENLLESEDRWQPPLVGHTARPGTVPLKLLNHLTQKVDHNEPKSPQPLGSATITEDHVTFGGDLNSEQVPEESSQSRSASPMSSDDVEWSSSPIRPPPMCYPADSPPILDRSGAVEIEHNVTINSCTKAKDQEDLQIELPTESSPIAQLERSDHALTSKRKSKSLSHNDKPISSGDGNQNQLPPSTLLNKIKPSLKSVQKTVQVKRTPFHAKESLPLDDALDSSTNMIPGTFDERSTFRTRTASSRLALAFSDESAVKKSGHEGDFEMDSSEDEDAIDRDHATITPSNHTLSRPNTEALISAHMGSSNHNGEREQSLGPIMKRKPENDQTVPHKRFKKHDEQQNNNNISRSDNASVDENRVRYRRQFMSAIAKKRNDIEQAVPSVPQSKVGTDTATSRGSEPNKTTLLSSPPNRQGAYIDTSETHVSVYRSFSRSDNTSTLKSMPEVPISVDRMMVEIYGRFKQTYPNYGGQEKHFSAACLLLKRLYVQDSATHPSLWDDFVFRHFHDYRDHLQEVMETSGNALPYEAFYQQCVEEPTCRDRIIRPTHLNALEADSTSAISMRLSSMQTTAKADMHLGVNPNMLSNLPQSVAAESSVSNIAAVKTPDAGSPDIQPAVEQVPQVVQTSTQNQVHEIDETLQQVNENSQDSLTSIKIWLERAAGAESPILGTSAVLNTEDVDMPSIDLAQDGDETSASVSLAVKQKQRRSLPWTTKSNKLTLMASEDGLRDSPLVAKETQITSTSTDSMHLLQNAASRTNSINLKEAARVPSPTLPPRQLTATIETPHQNQQPAVEGAFQRFVRFYNNLTSEGRVFQTEDARTRIDISTWRN